MFYDVAIAVPTNTSSTSPVEQIIKLTQGIIHRVEIEFPAGCAGLAHCRIYRNGHQYLPTNLDGDFSSDDYIIQIDDDYELGEAPYTLRAVCWNDDDTYDHTLTVRIGIMRGESSQLFMSILGGLQKFLKLVGIKT